MAAKMKCPNCQKILKEEGDEMKSSQGEYRIYSNERNSKEEAKRHTILECLNCTYIAKVHLWCE